MTRLLQTVTLLAFPHGGQRAARRNAQTPVERYGDGLQPARNRRTARATSTTANSLRRTASD